MGTPQPCPICHQTHCDHEATPEKRMRKRAIEFFREVDGLILKRQYEPWHRDKHARATTHNLQDRFVNALLEILREMERLKKEKK